MMWMLIAILIASSILLGIAVKAKKSSNTTINAQIGLIGDEPQPDVFNFWVYCPVSYIKETAKNIKVNDEQQDDQKNWKR